MTCSKIIYECPEFQIHCVRDNRKSQTITSLKIYLIRYEIMHDIHDSAYRLVAMEQKHRWIFKK